MNPSGFSSSSFVLRILIYDTATVGTVFVCTSAYVSDDSGMMFDPCRYEGFTRPVRPGGPSLISSYTLVFGHAH